MRYEDLWPTDDLWAPAPQREVAARLAQAFHATLPSPEALDGEGGFVRLRLSRIGRLKNSWRPIAVGRITAAAGGTLVEVRYEMEGAVAAVTGVMGILSFGVISLLAVPSFRVGLRLTRRELRRATGATHFGPDAIARANVDVADPSDPDAAARAPHSLRARSGGGVATLLVGGRKLHVLHPGLRIGEEVFPWPSLGSVQADGPVVTLRLENGRRVDLPGPRHPAEHLAWLAAYLEAEAARRRTQPSPTAGSSWRSDRPLM